MRRFELVEGTSAKFWEVDTRGATLVVRYGRLGSEGQSKEKALASPAAAKKEAEKLVAEKLGKGYSEVEGRAGKPAAKAKASSASKAAAASAPASSATAKAAKAAPAKAAAAKAVPAKKPAARMPIPGLGAGPGVFSFGAELDALFARGWPYLRVLSDEPISPAAAQRTAKAALQAIDPYLPTVVPREVARRVLRGYRFNPYQDEAAMLEAIAGDEPVDEALLHEVLRIKFKSLGGAGETYTFRLYETLYLFEAFLGTEPVARAVVEFLRAALEDPKFWGKETFWIDHHNANVRRLVPGFGFLRLRLAPATWRELVAPLAKPHPKLPRFSGTLRALADDTSDLDTLFELDEGELFAMQRRDKAYLDRWLAARTTCFDNAQLVYVRGAESLLDADLGQLCRDPKWLQQRTLAELGSIRAPGTVRVVGAFLASRSVSDLAADWLREHAAWVEQEALPVLAKRPADKALVAAVRAVLAGEPLPTPPSKAELKKDLARIFKELPAQMKACADDPKSERATMRAAFERYCEINAALGEVIPEAYFTHKLGLPWGASKERVTRWIDLGVDVAD